MNKKKNNNNNNTATTKEGFVAVTRKVFREYVERVSVKCVKVAMLLGQKLWFDSELQVYTGSTI